MGCLGIPSGCSLISEGTLNSTFSITLNSPERKKGGGGMWEVRRGAPNRRGRLWAHVGSCSKKTPRVTCPSSATFLDGLSNVLNNNLPAKRALAKWKGDHTHFRNLPQIPTTHRNCTPPSLIRLAAVSPNTQNSQPGRADLPLGSFICFQVLGSPLPNSGLGS